MVKNLLIFSFVLFISVAYSQDYDKRLLGKYSQSEIEKIKSEDPEEYLFLINALNKGVHISEIPSQKEIKFDGTLNIDPNEVHTFISLNKEITDSYQRYKIKGTDKMLTILPKIHLDKRVLDQELKKRNK
jgi:hypothetical protein